MLEKEKFPQDYFPEVGAAGCGSAARSACVAPDVARGGQGAGAHPGCVTLRGSEACVGPSGWF